MVCGRRDFKPHLEACVRSQIYGRLQLLIRTAAVGIHLPDPLGGLDRRLRNALNLVFYDQKIFSDRRGGTLIIVDGLRERTGQGPEPNHRNRYAYLVPLWY